MSKFNMLYSKLSQIKDINIYRNHNLAKYTTFNIGGKAKLFAKIDSISSLKYAIKLCNQLKIKRVFIGRGSNILITDKPLNMLVITLGKTFENISHKGNNVYCGGGASLFNINAYASKNGLQGMEWSYGIPGSVGGAVVMNAGCFSGEMKDIVSKVYYTDGYKEFCITNKYINFKYRDSFFKNKPYIITKVVLKLSYGDSKTIWLNCIKNFDKKKALQPYEYASAGSVFKKIDNTPAPILIQKANLKGLRIGDAQVSNKHCGFIVNLGRAKSRQVLKLINKIKKTIYKKFGIMLQMEIVFIGGK